MLITRLIQNSLRQFGPAIPMKAVSARLVRESVIVREAELNRERYLQNEGENEESLLDIFMMFGSLSNNRSKEFAAEMFPTSDEGATLLEQDRMRLWRYHSQRPQTISELAQRTLDEVLKKDNAPGLAIELGCGNSGLVIELLKKNWTVVALDNSPHALNALVKQIHSLGLSEIADKKLKYAFKNMEDYEFPKKVSLVFSENSFPYSKAEKFERLWDKIYGALKTDGCVGGNLWVSPLKRESEIRQRENGGVWFADKQMARALLSHKGYDVALLQQKGGWREKSGIIEFIGRKC